MIKLLFLEPEIVLQHISYINIKTVNQNYLSIYLSLLHCKIIQSSSDISEPINFAAKNLYSEGYTAKFVLYCRPVKFPRYSHSSWRTTSKKYCQVGRKLKKLLRTLDQQEKQEFIE